MTRNAEVAARLEEIAMRLEAEDVDFKPRAYRRAAENIRSHPMAVEQLAARGPDAVAEIEGVGDAISEKVVEYVETGEIEELRELRARMPADIEALTRVEGLGPKRVADLHEALGIEDLEDLEAAAREGKIRQVSGFGEKTERNYLEGVAFARQSRERSLLGDARPGADRVLGHLEDREAVGRLEVAGSLRRWKETIGDVDALVESEDGERVVEAFVDWPGAEEVIEAGPQKASVRAAGMRVDLRVVVPAEYGAALQYFTGSKEHNIAFRNRAIERNLKVNEYGVFDVSDVEEPDAGQRVGERVAGETEESVYAAVGLPWMAPELREDRGELAAAERGELPDLVAEGDVRGDLHVHTDWSDGAESIAEMAAGAARFGHDYVGVCDHATGPGMVGGVGLSDEELREQVAAVREAAEAADVRLFAGVEANVDAEGGVSVGDDVLDELDLVVASPHSGLEGDGTDRLATAIEHPSVDVIGHPTGRLLNQRAGMEIDVETVAKAAAEHGVALEVNSYPSRLDLDGGGVKVAVEEGATVAVDTDAHSTDQYAYVRYGVHTARRGWAEPGDVLNCRDAAGVAAFLGLE